MDSTRFAISAEVGRGGRLGGCVRLDSGGRASFLGRGGGGLEEVLSSSSVGLHSASK